VTLPHRAAVEGAQRLRTRGHVGESAQPDEAVRVVQVAKAAEDGHAQRLLRLDELALEQVDQHISLARVQRVLAELDRRDLAAGNR
jgi:hypothetical protein